MGLGYGLGLRFWVVFTIIVSLTLTLTLTLGAIQVLRNADGGGGCLIVWEKKRYEGVGPNVQCY